MIRYIYDGSFDGFLTAAAAVFSTEKDGPGEDLHVYAAGRAPEDLFTRDVAVVTDAESAEALIRRLESTAGPDEADMLLLAHASADPDVPRLLLAYMRRVFELGGAAAADVSRPEVLSVRKIRDRVLREIYRFLGFVRFVRTGNAAYYAAIEPDSDIAGFIGPHFADRLRDQSFIVHDRKRGIAFWHRAGGESGIAELTDLPPELSAAVQNGTDGVQALWREYFQRIAIRQRRNPALQAKLLPMRYRKYLTEVQDKVKGK